MIALWAMSSTARAAAAALVLLLGRLRRPAAALRRGGPTARHPSGAGRGVHVLPDGTRLPARVWLPPDGQAPTAVILALHGFNDSRDQWALPAPVFAASRMAGLRTGPARLRRHGGPRHLGRRAATGGRRGRDGARASPPLPVHPALRHGREHGRRGGAGLGRARQSAADCRHHHAVPRRVGPRRARLRARQRVGRRERGSTGLPHQGRRRAPSRCTPATTARRCWPLRATR